MTSGHREASRECWTGTGFGENHVKVTAAAMAIRATRSRTDIIDKKHTPQHKKVLYEFAICECRVALQHCYFGSTVLNPTLSLWLVESGWLLRYFVKVSGILIYCFSFTVATSSAPIAITPLPPLRPPRAQALVIAWGSTCNAVNGRRQILTGGQNRQTA